VSSWLRLSPILSLLLCTEGFLHSRSRPEPIWSHVQLSSFPTDLGQWHGQNEEILPEVLKVLGPGEFLSRIYQSPQSPYVDYFLAYFPSQRTGDTIHSPKNCLPGAGWVPVESGRIRLKNGSGPPIDANRYLLQKGDSQMFVLYWYESHGRTVASEYWAKYYLVADAISLNRTDGALVRVITPVESEESVATAEARAVSFTDEFLPVLDRYLPD
jgi:EpsI family protein